MGGCKISYENGDFYAISGSVKKLGNALIKLGTLSQNGSFNLSGYAGYRNFSVNNILINVKSINSAAAESPGNGDDKLHSAYATVSSVNVVKSYDANTGNLNISGLTTQLRTVKRIPDEGYREHGAAGYGTISMTVDVFLAG